MGSKVHNSECLLTADLGNGDEHRTCMSKSCEGALLTDGSLYYFKIS